MDDSLDRGEEDGAAASSKLNKKKILMIILPTIIIIGLIVSFYAVFNSKKKETKNYSVVTGTVDKDGSVRQSVFYDLPEISAALVGSGDSSISAQINLKITLETEETDKQKIDNLEALSSKINDIIIMHLVELTPEEVNSSEKLYWLKEELLYRINLVTAPMKINSINFKSFEIQNERK